MRFSLNVTGRLKYFAARLRDEPEFLGLIDKRADAHDISPISPTAVQKFVYDNRRLLWL